MTILTPDFDVAGAMRSGSRIGAAPPAPTGKAESAVDEHICADARLYLRHVEDGVSIRALAREAGCHASTMLRRIRRFEARRDDPLVDAALKSLGMDEMPPRPSRDCADQTRRILRRMAEPAAEMIVSADLPNAIVTRGEIRIAVLARSLAETFALKGWLELAGQGKKLHRYRISPAGRAALRRLRRGDGGMPCAGDFADARPVGGNAEAAAPGMADGAASFDHAGQHRVWGMRDLPDPDDQGPRRMRVNMAESPLQLLSRRRDASGKPFLSPAMIAAGERLREDFEQAQMGPRVSQNWDRFLTAGVTSSAPAGSAAGGSERARARVAEALRELGPGMGDLVLRVCCFLDGLEMTERRLGWSARSGKVVLRLALDRLARHYEDRYGPGGPLIG
ncbi:hypothetical protein SAMN05421538_102342 [Paracoccus isoporae]|uniref:DUF6456 domain-containing protein n=1 Tax=Paracoccus isoporae TaxID=591205 RepID=A0A1G6X9Y0_9RHOB|nr:DUF6456 domain-containing protein [Paracoccus isoporae]SDD74964.1 hypothetical protein SAMN05421538_102342 [Paracoccus isoporae]